MKAQKINHMIFLLLATLLPPLQAAQFIVKDNTQKNSTHKTLVSLFEIRGVRLAIIKYIDCKDKALRLSAGLGYLDCVKYLVRQSDDIDTSDKILIISACYGHLDCLQWLCQYHTHKKNNYNKTALLPSTDWIYLACTKYLISQDDPYARNENKYTALILSAYKGHLTCLKYLVTQDPDIDVKHWYGATALRSSAQNGYFNCVKFLVEQGANIYAKNEQGATALHLSTQNGHYHCANFLQQQSPGYCIIL